MINWKKCCFIFIIQLLFFHSFCLSIYGQTMVQIMQNDKNFMSEQKFQTEHFMTGLFSQEIESFFLEEWEIEQISLQLQYSTTQLVQKEVSDFTISLNGVRFYSTHLDSTNGKKEILTIPIPKEFLKQGRNELTLEGYLRVTESFPCADDVSSANWMNIFSDSIVSILYKPQIKLETISDFYKAFSSVTASDYEMSAVVVNSNNTNGEMAAAIEIFSGTKGNSENSQNSVELMDFSNEQWKTKQYIIVVSRYENLPLEYQAYFSKEEKLLLENNAGIKLVPTKEHDFLFVTGNNETAFQTAAKAFQNSDWMAQLQGDFHSIFPKEDIFIRETEQNKNDFILTEQGTTVQGLFTQKADFYIPFSPNKKIGSASELYLSIRYAENLNFARSLVTVFLNDKPIGSHKLTLEQAQKDNFVLAIPNDLDISGNFKLTIAFELQVEDLWCTKREGETPWAFITKDSLLHLNTIEVSELLFENYPSPFIKNGNWNDLVFVLPDTMTNTDYETLSTMLVALREFLTGNKGNIAVQKASQITNLENKQVITLGTFQNNAYIQKLNHSLFFSFDEKGTTILSNEKKAIEAFYGSQLGTVQLLDNQGFGILVATGCTEKGMKDAVSYLGKKEEFWKLKGDGYIAFEDDFFQYQFKKENSSLPVINKQLLKRSDLTMFTVMIFSVISILLLTMWFMFLKYRRKK